MPEPQPRLMDTPQRVEDVEARFKESLQDVLEVAEKLSPYCHSVEDLLTLLHAALKDDAHLRLIMGKVIKRR